MSGVSGACRKARPAKITRPSRSPSRSPGEVAQRLAGDHQPVARLEVARLHAARDVERDHDVPRLAPDLAHLVRHLRARERHDQQGERQRAERVGEPGPPAATRDRRAGEEREPREADPLLGRPAPGPPARPREERRGRAGGGDRRGQRTASAASRVLGPRRASRRAVRGPARGSRPPPADRASARELHEVGLVEDRRAGAAQGALAQVRRQRPEQLAGRPLARRQLLGGGEIVAKHVRHRLVVADDLALAWPSARARCRASRIEGRPHTDRERRPAPAPPCASAGAGIERAPAAAAQRPDREHERRDDEGDRSRVRARRCQRSP